MNWGRLSRKPCAGIDEWLSAYADNQVEPEAARAMQTHLADCPRCAALFKRHQGTRRLLHLSSADSWNPPDLRLRVTHAIARPRRRRALWPAGLLASAAIMILLGVFVSGQASWWQAASPVAVPPAAPATATVTLPHTRTVRSCPDLSGRALAACLGVSMHWLPTVLTTERSRPATLIHPLTSVISPSLLLERHATSGSVSQSAPKGGGSQTTNHSGLHGLVPL